MSRAKQLVLAGIAAAVILVGGAMWFESPPVAQAAPERVKNHWRYHDGHWSYWDSTDSAWYYTDGTNWYYSSGDAWKPYRFDRGFGREGFERGDYKAPAADARVVVPTHRVYVAPRQ